jgi:hypothetical protein
MLTKLARLALVLVWIVLTAVFARTVHAQATVAYCIAHPFDDSKCYPPVPGPNGGFAAPPLPKPAPDPGIQLALPVTPPDHSMDHVLDKPVPVFTIPKPTPPVNSYTPPPQTTTQEVVRPFTPVGPTPSQQAAQRAEQQREINENAAKLGHALGTAIAQMRARHAQAMARKSASQAQYKPQNVQANPPPHASTPVVATAQPQNAVILQPQQATIAPPVRNVSQPVQPQMVEVSTAPAVPEISVAEAARRNKAAKQAKEAEAAKENLPQQ